MPEYDENGNPIEDGGALRAKLEEALAENQRLREDNDQAANDRKELAFHRADLTGVDPRQLAYFRDKYKVNILERFRDQFDSLRADGSLKALSDVVVTLTREGLMRVDALLKRFFLPEHAGIRYT